MIGDKIQTISHMEYSLFLPPFLSLSSLFSLSSLLARSLIFSNYIPKKVQKASCICSLHRPPQNQESNEEINKSLV